MNISNQTTTEDPKVLARERGIDSYQRMWKAELRSVLTAGFVDVL